MTNHAIIDNFTGITCFREGKQTASLNMINTSLWCVAINVRFYFNHSAKRNEKC